MKRFAVVLVMVLGIVFSGFGNCLFAAQPTEQKGPPPLSGKVVETMDAGRYTYVCLQKDGERTWLAVPKMKVVVGQNMSFKPGIEMVNFQSKILKRNFEKIFFSEGPIVSHVATDKKKAK